MSISKLDEGKRGEDLACDYLKGKGYKIIERNFRIRGGEIDIVAISPSTHDVRSASKAAKTGMKEEEALVFIEVKTRSSSEFGSPFESITPWKVRTLIKSAQFYKIKHPTLPDLMRIDAIGIKIDYQKGTTEIEHIKNIS